MSKLDGIRNWWRSIRQQPSQFSVRCDEAGLTQIVQQGDSIESSRLGWDEVTEAFAYKRDCFSVDQICVVIRTADPTDWIEVREDDDGYQLFIQSLPKCIAGFPLPDEWLEKVRLPPFATQWTQIYVRAPGNNLPE
jgi:hypothetical protein